MGLDRRTIDTGPVRLAVLEAGAGGRPLLLVHGFTGAKEDFAGHLDALAARGYHGVAPDLRGHGESDHPDGGYDLDTLAADIRALQDALGWTTCALLGHSMGGMVAQTAALAAPDRLAALILEDTTGAEAKISPALVELACEVVAGGGMAALVEAQRTLADPLETRAARRLRLTRPGWAEYGEGKVLASSPRMYVALARALVSAPSRLDRLRHLGIPTLVLVGDEDEVFLADSRDLATTVPGARLVVLDRAGHSPHHEAPEAWLDAVAGFLDGLDPARWEPSPAAPWSDEAPHPTECPSGPSP